MSPNKNCVIVNISERVPPVRVHVRSRVPAPPPAFEMSSNWSCSLRRRAQPSTEAERTGTPSRHPEPAPARRQTWTPSPWRRSPAGWTRRVRLLVGPVLGASHHGGPLTAERCWCRRRGKQFNVASVAAATSRSFGVTFGGVAVELATLRGSPVGVLVAALSRPQVCSLPSGAFGSAPDFQGSIKRLRCF